MNGKEEKAGMKDKAVKKATAKVREKAQKRTQARKGKKKGSSVRRFFVETKN